MLKKLQAATGVIFFIFVLLHLFNTWLAAFGADAYDGFQAAARAGYQFLPVEILLLAALATHLVVGITRIVVEPRRSLNARAKWHRYAGIFLAVFIVGHIFAVRGPSWFFDIYPGFEGLAFSIDYAPWYFFPYYFLLGLAGFYHGINGVGIALGRLGFSGRMVNPVVVPATAFAGVFTLAALLGLYGVWTDVGQPYESEFAKLAFEILDGFSS